MALAEAEALVAAVPREVGNMIKKWIKSYLSDSDLERISGAVASAELKTSGELVPMVVRRSSTVGHVPLILMLGFAVLFFVFDLDYLQLQWLPLPHWLLIALDLLLLTAFVRLLSPNTMVERLLTSKFDQEQQVEQRAMLEFYNHNINHTIDATGILIFVSVMERRAVVLGDKSISDKLSSEDWQHVIDRLTQGVKSKNLAQGFVDAIGLSGELLEKHFPIKPDDKNELRNQLIIKD